jgi:hypothetical protein
VIVIGGEQRRGKRNARTVIFRLVHSCHTHSRHPVPNGSRPSVSATVQEMPKIPFALVDLLMWFG